VNDDERAIVSTVRQFVGREVLPVASELEHTDTCPEALIEAMKGLGVYGLVVPPEHGGMGGHSVVAS
jgi:alkylation response protein AidB-like acyl-CoA dehydrogenase